MKTGPLEYKLGILTTTPYCQKQITSYFGLLCHNTGCFLSSQLKSTPSSAKQPQESPCIYVVLTILWSIVTKAVQEQG